MPPSTTSSPHAIGRALDEALALTRTLAASSFDEESLLAMLNRRGRLLDAAEELRLSGAPWGESEAAIARQLIELDAGVLASIARTNRDVLGWLAARAPEIATSLPGLSSLCRVEGPGTSSEAHDRPSVEPRERANAAARYARPLDPSR